MLYELGPKLVRHLAVSMAVIPVDAQRDDPPVLDIATRRAVTKMQIETSCFVENHLRALPALHPLLELPALSNHEDGRHAVPLLDRSAPRKTARTSYLKCSPLSFGIEHTLS